MRGLDVARGYYETFGKAAIHENFPEWEEKIAVGLAGSGSECYGFDDSVSTDHDFEPGFCIWIPEEDEMDSKTAFRLERMYAKLPKEYAGLKKIILQPVGGSRHGVIRISEFLERHIGRKDAELSLYDWFSIPEFALSEIVNGEIWRDDSGKFTAVRRKISQMPEDVRLKKLAGNLYMMGQSGEYNFNRCLLHGEIGAAQLALAQFTVYTLHTVFLLNQSYMPYYKWSFRALKKLPVLPALGERLECLLNTGNETYNIEMKKDLIRICTQSVINILKETELSTKSGEDIGCHADSVNGKIKDNYIRNTDLLAGVSTSF